ILAETGAAARRAAKTSPSATHSRIDNRITTRIFLNIERLRSARSSGPVRDATRVVADHVSRATFPRPQKRKTRRWERRVRHFCYRSLRFQVCGLAVVHVGRKRGSGCFSCTADFSSSSSLFLFFDFVSKFNRSLCEFASISVGLRTHSSLGGDGSRVARAMPAAFFVVKSYNYSPKRPLHFRSRQALVKGIDNDLT